MISQCEARIIGDATCKKICTNLIRTEVIQSKFIGLRVVCSHQYSCRQRINVKQAKKTMYIQFNALHRPINKNDTHKSR